MNIGRAIREIRKEKDIRQKEVILKLNITPGAFSHIENSDYIPRIQSLHRIAQALNTSTIEILFRALDDEDLTKEQAKNCINHLLRKL